MMVRAADDWMRAMQALDEEVQARVGVPASLAPGRARAQSLLSIARELVGGREAGWQQAFVEATTTVLHSLLEHFPGNLYWDLDFLLAALLDESDTPDDLLVRAAAVARLQELFGCRSAIAFRYLHDFTYGFDWARWTARKPAERAGSGPFSTTFLAHVERRGREIAEAIEAGDARFPRLRPGEFRNPFPFSRTPEHEAHLLTDLAGRDLIPVYGWCTTARPRFDLPFAELREERARALGLPPGPGQGG
ncbi:MAG: ferrochelatase [Gammaproteobacteria bacterium]|nr:ferrochelatase [Gammaproteobacteria bacterium]